MSKINLAILVKVDKEEVRAAAEGNCLDALREKVFREVFEFLAAQEPGNFMPCVPADYAWEQKVYERFGVVFGAAEPALFGYFHVKSRMFLEERVMKKIVSEGVRLFDGNSEESGISTLLLSGENLIKNPWIAGVFSGGFVYDCGFYSIPHRKASLEDAENEQIRHHYQDYAICVLDVYGQR